MNRKTKQITDVAMMIAMFFSMSFHLCGPGAHKGIGLFTFLLFLMHSILNRKWYHVLLKGKYSWIRIVHTITIAVILLSVLAIMVSGVILSKEMASGTGGTMTTGRILHNVSSYAACIGIALHIGFHLKGRKGYDD